MWHEFKQSWIASWNFASEGWRSFARVVFRRYWLTWIMNFIIGLQLFLWLDRVIEFRYFFIPAILIVLYFALSPLSLLLWLPQYLSQKKPHLYRGLIRSIGEWIGKPYPHLGR